MILRLIVPKRIPVPSHRVVINLEHNNTPNKECSGYFTHSIAVRFGYIWITIMLQMRIFEAVITGYFV